MFNFFRKKSQIEILQEKYTRLMEEAHKLSTTNRKESDKKYAEAHDVMNKIEALNK